MIEPSGEIPNVQALLTKVLEVNEIFPGQVWWRGQRDQSWSLAPGIFREQHYRISESSYMSRFQNKAPSRHSSVPSPNDRASWLFLMQHYRLPTRLLDWTESPLLAAYFAAEENLAHRHYPDVIRDSDGAIFALYPYELNNSQIGKSALLLPEDPDAKPLIDGAFASESDKDSRVIALRPAEVDLRLMVQLSVFTLHGDALEIDQLPDAENFLLRYTVPSGAKATLRDQLKHLGIRQSTIFPDLEHLASEVAEARFSKASLSVPQAKIWIETPPRDPEDST